MSDDLDDLDRRLTNALAAFRDLKLRMPKLQAEAADAEKRKDAARAEHDNILAGIDALLKRVRPQ
jgi:hypothetical protein